MSTTPGHSPQPKNADALRRKLDQVRNMVFQRVSEQQEAVDRLVAKRERLLQQHDHRIQEVLAGGAADAGAHGEHRRPGDIEDVVRDERTQARRRAEHESEPECSRNSRSTPRRKHLPPTHPADGSLLSTPVPKGGPERAQLAAKLEAEKQELDEDLTRAIQQLKAAHSAEIAHIDAAATDILGAVRPAEARQLATEMSKRRGGRLSLPASPSRGLFQNFSDLYVGGLDEEDDDEEDDWEEGGSSNPFDAYFRYQAARLRVLKRGGFASGVSLEKEAKGAADAGGRAAQAAWSMVSVPGDTEMAEEGIGAVLMLYLQSAVRHMPKLLSQSSTIASQCSAAARGGEVAADLRGDQRRVQGQIQEVLKRMLDGDTQRSCHQREKDKATHACSLCVMEALGVEQGGDRVSKGVFVASLCWALSSVVSATRIVRATERRGHQT